MANWQPGKKRNGKYCRISIIILNQHQMRYKYDRLCWVHVLWMNSHGKSHRKAPFEFIWASKMESYDRWRRTRTADADGGGDGKRVSAGIGWPVWWPQKETFRSTDCESPIVDYIFNFAFNSMHEPSVTDTHHLYFELLQISSEWTNIHTDVHSTDIFAPLF